MSRLIEISASQLDQLISRVNRASRTTMRGLLDAVGQQQEDAAVNRIQNTKKEPDGTDWREWSVDYAKTRKPQHSQLIESGTLGRAMTHQPVAPDAVEVGSATEYAAAHLFGFEDIPARPYLDTDGGFADPEDRADLRDIVDNFLSELFEGGGR